MSKEKEVIPEATQTEILADGEMVDGFLVKPWTISKSAKISPVLEKILIEVKKRNLTFKDFIEVVKDKDGNDRVKIINLDQLFFCIIPYAPELLTITLDKTIEEIDKASVDIMYHVIPCIIRQNISYLKNSVALMTSVVRTIKVN